MHQGSLRRFTDDYWSHRDQEIGWRHEAAVRLTPAEPVLDVGGGDGLFLSLLKERKGWRRLTLVDVSRVAVRKASGKGLESLVADCSIALPFPDRSFSTACAIDLLEHLHDPLGTLREMARVAHHVVVTVPNFHYWKDRARMVMGEVPFQSKPKRGHTFWFNLAVLRALIREAGMTPEETMLAGFRRVGPLGGWLARIYPNLFADSIAVRMSRA